MIPRWLEIEGIRSFVAPRRIDFADLGLFAVLGDTGAGKSSILEAIVYALFNGTTWDGASVKELMSTGATRMRVRFCFSLNDRTYTVSRIKPREGVASHLLVCDGSHDERRDSETAVNKRLEALLGVNRETFTKTVVLPQGEFAALLALADRPAKRAELLTSILGLNRLDAMVQTLTTPRERARGLRAQFQGARSRLAANPAAAVVSADAAIASAGERRIAIECTLAALDVRQRALDALVAASASRVKLREQFAVVPTNVTTLEALLVDDARLESDLAAAIEHQRTVVLALAEADVERRRRAADGQDAAALRTIVSTLEKLRTNVRERARELDEEAQRQSAAVAAAEAVDTAAAHCKSGEADEVAARARLDATRVATIGATAILQTAQIAEGNLMQSRASCREAQTNAELAARRIERAASEYDRATASDRTVEAVLAAAEAHLLDAQRANAAAFAAQNCCAGEACPICDRPLPVDFTPPLAADIELAQRASKEAHKAAQTAQKQLVLAQAAHDAAEQSQAEAIACAAASRAALDDAMDAARAAGLDPAAAENTLTVAGLQTAAVERQSAFEAADRTVRQTAANLAALSATYAGTVKANKRAKEELASCRAHVESRDRTLRTLLEALPARYRPALEPSAVDNIIHEVSVRLEDASGFEHVHNRAALDAKDAQAAVHRLEAYRAVEILAPSRAIRSRLTAGALGLEACALAFDAGTIEAAPPAPPNDANFAAVLAWAQGLASAVGTALRAVDAADANDARQAATERKEIAELIHTQGVTDSAALTALRDAALQAQAVAQQTLQLAQADVRAAADLDAQLARLEPLARALDALHAALGDGKFKRFVAARKEQRLLGVATTILGRMTDERYGFGPAMRIVDRAAGQERSPQTLSGGEKFLASLALAFALVEIAARSGGHFGALFLDEGFGSLDLRALDQALSELERQAAGGRMIGVITHVREVTEYIDDVLHVRRTPEGSDVARLDRADLDALVAETATLAIGGL